MAHFPFLAPAPAFSWGWRQSLILNFQLEKKTNKKNTGAVLEMAPLSWRNSRHSDHTTAVILFICQVGVWSPRAPLCCLCLYYAPLGEGGGVMFLQVKDVVCCCGGGYFCVFCQTAAGWTSECGRVGGCLQVSFGLCGWAPVMIWAVSKVQFAD